MTISVACSCGQRLAAPDQLAGKRAKCPKCGRLLAIPVPSRPASGRPASGRPASGRPEADAASQATDTFSDLLDEAGVRVSRTGVRCPECGEDMPQGAVLCVACGYRIDLKRRLKTVTDETEEEEEKKDEFAGKFEPHGVELLDQAERELLRLKEQEKNLTRGFPWWGYLILFALLMSFLVGMMIRPAREVFSMTGSAVAIIGGVVIAWFFVVLAVIAFRENLKRGLLFLFVAPYSLYYIITRWKRCRSPFKSAVIGAFIVGGGFLLRAIGSRLH